LIDTHYWDYSGNIVSIGIHNKDSNSEIEFDFKISEHITLDIFKGVDRKKFDWYNQAYES